MGRGTEVQEEQTVCSQGCNDLLPLALNQAVKDVSVAEDALPKGWKKERGICVGLCTGGDLLGSQRRLFTK